MKPIVACQRLNKFGMFTCVRSTYNGFRSIFFGKGGGDQILVFLWRNTKWGEQFSKERD